MHTKLNQEGRVDPLAIPLVISKLLLVGASIFGIWSYLQFLDQRDNVDQIVAEAVVAAEEAQKVTLEADFAEREKSPTRKWVSRSSVGSVEINYPKTWSAFVEEKDTGSKPLSGFFHPSVVPADDSTRYAVRILIDETKYSKVTGDFEKEIEKGEVTAKPITVAGVTGTRFDGQIDKDYSGAMVVFALRDKTLRIWTESEAYLKDFNEIVIKNLTFEK